MRIIKLINLTLAFLLELILVFIPGWWGYHVGNTRFISWALAVLLPSVFITIWALWLAPKAKRRAREPIRTIVKTVLCLMTVFTLVNQDKPVYGIVFGSLFLLNLLLLKFLGEDISMKH